MVSESDLKTIHDAAAASLEHIYLNIGRHCEILTKKSDQWEREHSGTHPIHHDREEFRKVVEYLVRIAKELCDIRSSIENESLAEKLSLFTPAPELKQKSSLGSRWSYSSHHSHIFDYCNEFLRVLFATASLPDGITSLSSFESIIGNPRNKSLFEEEQRKERFWQQLLSRNTPQIIERKIARLTDLLLPRIPRSSNSSFGSWGLPKDLARLAIFEDRFQMSAAEYHRVSEELALELRLAQNRVVSQQQISSSDLPYKQNMANLETSELANGGTMEREERDEGVKPSWDRESLTLTYGGAPPFRIMHRRAESQIKILDAFQEDEWKRRIDSPFSPDKARAAIYRLRIKMIEQAFPILVNSDGTGEGIEWMTVQEYHARQQQK